MNSLVKTFKQFVNNVREKFAKSRKKDQSEEEHVDEVEPSRPGRSSQDSDNFGKKELPNAKAHQNSTKPLNATDAEKNRLMALELFKRKSKPKYFQIVPSCIRIREAREFLRCITRNFEKYSSMDAKSIDSQDGATSLTYYNAEEKELNKRLDVICEKIESLNEKYGYADGQPEVVEDESKDFSFKHEFLLNYQPYDKSMMMFMRDIVRRSSDDYRRRTFLKMCLESDAWNETNTKQRLKLEAELAAGVRKEVEILEEETEKMEMFFVEAEKLIVDEILSERRGLLYKRIENILSSDQ